jgi:hypothetical protein
MICKDSGGPIVRRCKRHACQVQERHPKVWLGTQFARYGWQERRVENRRAKSIFVKMRSVVGLLALIAVMCFAGPLAWPRLDLTALLLMAVGASIGLLIFLLPRIRP